MGNFFFCLYFLRSQNPLPPPHPAPSKVLYQNSSPTAVYLFYLLPVDLLLPPHNLFLCSVSTPPPLLFSQSIRHNQPLVSGLAWLWCSATCFSSSFSHRLGFVPSASNRLFWVWVCLFLTLPSLVATGLSLSKWLEFLAWRVSLSACEGYSCMCMSTRICIFVLLFCCCCSCLWGDFSPPFATLILCNHCETIL